MKLPFTKSLNNCNIYKDYLKVYVNKAVNYPNKTYYFIGKLKNQTKTQFDAITYFMLKIFSKHGLPDNCIYTVVLLLENRYQLN